MKNEAAKSGSGTSKIVKSVMAGTVVGSVVLVLTACLVSFVIVKLQTVNAGTIAPAALLSACFGALAGGYTAAMIQKSMGMATGALCGFVMTLLFLLAGMAAGGEIGTVTLLRSILMTLGGAVGGVLGVNKKRKRK